MTSTEIKEKIIEILDKMPEDKLSDILQYLEAIPHTQMDRATLYKAIDRIFKEDHELLQRLADS